MGVITVLLGCPFMKTRGRPDPDAATAAPERPHTLSAVMTASVAASGIKGVKRLSLGAGGGGEGTGGGGGGEGMGGRAGGGGTT